MNTMLLSKCWVATTWNCIHRLRHQQRGGGVMFRVGIMGNMVGQWQIPNGVEMTAQTYIDFFFFFKVHMEPWFKKKPNTIRKMIFLCTTTLHHIWWGKLMIICVSKALSWRRSQLNLPENLWNILKRKVYLDGQQFTNKVEHWNAILDVMQSVSYESI